jgi:hypothetical protein
MSPPGSGSEPGSIPVPDPHIFLFPIGYIVVGFTATENFAKCFLERFLSRELIEKFFLPYILSVHRANGIEINFTM